ncbi:MAG TPA: hypothetical protein VK689_19265 [Armatimonadota bacterium]|nr:hypothetical protein [Armatimonadota bacterium]
MSKVENKQRHTVRAIAAGAAGLFLLSTAYQAAFADGSPGGGPGGFPFPGPFPFPGNGPFPRYPPVGGGQGRGNNNSNRTAAYAAGAAIVVGGILVGTGVIGGGAGRDDDDDDDSGEGEGGDAARAPQLPAGEKKATSLRLTPGSTVLASGSSRTFDLQARSAVDGKWYSVTARPEASVRVKSGGDLVVRQDGTKNVFCVPITASRTGQVEVVGTFAPEGGAPQVVTAQVQVTGSDTQ